MTTLTPIPPYDAPADSGGKFDNAEELELFGPEHHGERAEPAAAEPAAAPKPRGKPGPKADPNSARQKKLRDAAQRAKTAAAPPRRAAPNNPARAAANPMDTWQAGALALTGWVTKPLAMGGFALGVAAQQPKMTQEKRARTVALSNALTLDSLTVAMHADALAVGVAGAAPNLPWLQRVLENAAKVGPYAGLAEVSVAIVLQVLCNHGVLPPMAALGTLSPAELAAAAGVPMEAPSLE